MAKSAPIRQAIASKTEAEVQTDPQIPTNASTQYAPETEIAIVDTATARASVTSHNLDGFFQKYKDYLEQCLAYNEVYDLYHDDYPALYMHGEEAQVQQQGLYHQYQSFTDVAAIEGKLVVSSSWHPNFEKISEVEGEEVEAGGAAGDVLESLQTEPGETPASSRLSLRQQLEAKSRSGEPNANTGS